MYFYSIGNYLLRSSVKNTIIYRIPNQNRARIFEITFESFCQECDSHKISFPCCFGLVIAGKFVDEVRAVVKVLSIVSESRRDKARHLYWNYLILNVKTKRFKFN